MKKVLIFTVGVAATWLYFSAESTVILKPGVQVTVAPQQSDISDVKPFTFKGYSITPLANIDFSAKILSKKNYSTGELAKLVPVDLALGWQNMSDQTVVDQITISQSNRWYRWSGSGTPPIPLKEIKTQSANMHMVPANNQVEHVLKKTKKGQIISISGYLIKINDKNRVWESSLTRNDTGSGACEIIYVRSLDILVQ